MIAYEHLQMMNSSGKLHKMTAENVENTYAVISVCMAAFFCKTNKKKSVDVLEHFINNIFENSQIALKIVNEYLTIIRNSINEDSFFISNKSNSIGSLSEYDWNVENKANPENFCESSNLENLFFITCFVPHIQENTPLIRLSELQKVKKRMKKTDYIESSYPELSSKESQILSRKMPYKQYLKSLFSKYKKPFPSVYQNNGPRQLKNLSKRKTSENHKNSVFDISETKKAKNTRYLSEPRGQKIEKILPSVYSPTFQNQSHAIRENSHKGSKLRMNIDLTKKIRQERFDVHLIPISRSNL